MKLRIAWKVCKRYCDDERANYRQTTIARSDRRLQRLGAEFVSKFRTLVRSIPPLELAEIQFNLALKGRDASFLDELK